MSISRELPQHFSLGQRMEVGPTQGWIKIGVSIRNRPHNNSYSIWQCLYTQCFRFWKEYRYWCRGTVKWPRAV